MDDSVRPDRCPFCGAATRTLYILETTPTHGSRFVAFDGYIGCENGGVIGFSGSFLADGRPSFFGYHPRGVTLLKPNQEWR